MDRIPVRARIHRGRAPGLLSLRLSDLASIIDQRSPQTRDKCHTADQVRELWSANIHEWGDEHTAAAKAHIAILSLPSST